MFKRWIMSHYEPNISDGIIVVELLSHTPTNKKNNHYIKNWTFFFLSKIDHKENTGRPA